jgi:hydroxysqualene synthase
MNAAIPRTLADDYAVCGKIARDHYENFPVVSLLVPGRLRPHVAAVYAFARGADDLADEGTVSAARRLEALAEWRRRLAAAIAGRSDDTIFRALGNTIRTFEIPGDYFHALLDAFVQDVEKHEYETFHALLAYCRRSANPVGAIMLSLFGCLSPRTIPPSDALCTGLQLANFWQDVSIDVRKPRFYIPGEDLDRFGVRRMDLAAGMATPAIRDLIRFEVQRTKEYFANATLLFPLVPWRLRMNLRAIHSGGARILRSIEAIDYNVTARRPVVKKGQAIAILLSSVFSSGRNSRS